MSASVLRPRKRFTWCIMYLGLYMLLTVCGWTIVSILDQQGAFGGDTGNASGIWYAMLLGIEALPVAAVIFGIPTAIALLFLAFAGRAKTGFRFRWRAIALIVPAGGLCFFIPSYPIWFTQTAVQFLLALLVQPPPNPADVQKFST